MIEPHLIAASELEICERLAEKNPIYCGVMVMYLPNSNCAYLPNFL